MANLISSIPAKLLTKKETEKEEIMGLQKFESYAETCDNPRCNKGEGGGAKSVKWTEEQMKTNPDTLDAGFFRLIRKQLWQNENQQPVLKNLTFCSEQCDRYWMRDVYKFPLGPQELAELANQTKQSELKFVDVIKSPEEAAARGVMKYEPPAPPPTQIQNTPTDNRPVAIAQADGAA